MLKSNKAISPVLATLLLVVIAVAAVTVTYAWIMNYVGSSASESVILYKASVSFYTDSGGTGKIDVSIGDSGNAGTQILRVFVGVSSSSMQSQTTVPVVPVSISAGSTVKFTLPYNWTAGSTYFFKIVPTAGQQALAFQVQASQ